MGSLAAKRKSLKGEFICGSNVVRARWNKGESVQHKRRGYISIEKISIPGIMWAYYVQVHKPMVNSQRSLVHTRPKNTREYQGICFCSTHTLPLILCTDILDILLQYISEPIRLQNPRAYFGDENNTPQTLLSSAIHQPPRCHRRRFHHRVWKSCSRDMGDITSVFILQHTWRRPSRLSRSSFLLSLPFLLPFSIPLSRPPRRGKEFYNAIPPYGIMKFFPALLTIGKGD